MEAVATVRALERQHGPDLRVVASVWAAGGAKVETTMTDRERAIEAMVAFAVSDKCKLDVVPEEVAAMLDAAGLDDKFFQDAAVGKWVGSAEVGEEHILYNMGDHWWAEIHKDEGAWVAASARGSTPYEAIKKLEEG